MVSSGSRTVSGGSKPRRSAASVAKRVSGNKNGIKLSTTGTNTSSGRRRYLSAAFGGGEVATDYPVIVFINAVDLKILEGNGFKGVFGLGENAITMGQTTELVMATQAKLKKLKDVKRKAKLAKVVNHIMSTFGPAYIRSVGGYLKTGY